MQPATSSSLHLPRRHHRRLLFPPGLLALAGLLWLGCLALRPWHEELRTKTVVQLTMPLPGYANAHDSVFTFRIPSPDSAEKMRPWRDAYFSGQQQADGLEQACITAGVLAMKADTINAGGVRVRFNSTAHYAQFVWLLDLMNRENIRKYWFDNNRNPLTFYAITDAYRPLPLELRGCFLCDDIIKVPYTPPVIPFWVRFGNWITEFWQFNWLGALVGQLFTWLRPLVQLEWRASVLVFAAIVAVGSWRIFQQWRAASR